MYVNYLILFSLFVCLYMSRYSLRKNIATSHNIFFAYPQKLGYGNPVDGVGFLTPEDLEQHVFNVGKIGRMRSTATTTRTY